MNKINIKDITKISIVAAIYVALTVALSPLSYGAIQFRISEALLLLVIFNRKYAISMILGCFVANLFSPVGFVDVIFGTIATTIAVIPMMYIKRIWLASLIPSIVNGLVIGLQLSILYELPIFLTIAQVFIGEFVVVTLIGIPLINYFSTNKSLTNILELKEVKQKQFLNKNISLNLSVLIISIIMFFKLPVIIFDDVNTITLFDFIKDDNNYFILIIPFLIILNFIVLSFLYKKTILKQALSSVIFIMFLGITIIPFIYYTNINIAYYCIYLIPITNLLLSIFVIKDVPDKINIDLTTEIDIKTIQE
ncbi:MAG: QueT transporter family protein [Anaeroplasmataceae bacterium]